MTRYLNDIKRACSIGCSEIQRSNLFLRKWSRMMLTKGCISTLGNDNFVYQGAILQKSSIGENTNVTLEREDIL
jgi:hypothetical protein